MSAGRGPARGARMAQRWRRYGLWLSGLWVSPLGWILFRVAVPSHLHTFLIIITCCALAPVPAFAISSQREARLEAEQFNAAERAEQLKLQLETLRYRAERMREELSAADRQARLSRQLTLLGRFTAGFLHEFNNPLAILTSRIEVLLEERKADADLGADLHQMLKETRYMAKIAGTLLHALRRERGENTFEPCVPAEALEDVLASLSSPAAEQGVRLIAEPATAPRVNLPAHVLIEVASALVANSLQALAGRSDGTVWLRLEPYYQPGSKVVLKIEDNGPGVPEELREHLFEPFVSQSPGKERLGLGLFLAASLLDAYQSSLRYEPRAGGGAGFVIEMPPDRFTEGRDYYWFYGGGVSV